MGPVQERRLGQSIMLELRTDPSYSDDPEVTDYLTTLGYKLVGAGPDARQEFNFFLMQDPQVNAFALPGGFIGINSGLILTAQSESELAGVMAHEISHVTLRHGTAQASKAGRYQTGQVAGAVLGAIIGGRLGAVVAQTTQFGLGAAFLRFGREYEKQADIMGAQLMARAGYDARDMAAMFRTIEKQGGSNGPEWLSDHPNPGNRSAYIEQEAQIGRAHV